MQLKRHVPLLWQSHPKHLRLRATAQSATLLRASRKRKSHQTHLDYSKNLVHYLSLTVTEISRVHKKAILPKARRI